MCRGEMAWDEGCRAAPLFAPSFMATPAWMTVVEPRREQAAEEGGPGGEGVAGFAGWRVGLLCLWLLFPLCGNDLFKPLDSGLRRNDE